MPNNEVGKAIYTTSKWQSEVLDGNPAEFVMSLNSKLREKFVELCKLICKNGKWPKDILKCKSVL